MFDKLFNHKTYLDCPLMKHSLHFFYDEIRACCTNVSGPVFYKDYKGENVDWNYIYNVRKNYIKQINSLFKKNILPNCCTNCCDAKNFYSDKKIKDFDNKVNRLYFHTNMSCNAKCIYCTYANIERGYRYKVLPLVKSLINNKILDKNAQVYMSGGEITISPEFEDLLSLLLNYLDSRIEILTSGIKYCESVKQAFIKDKCSLVISLDSSCAETYKKIKQVDCFDKIIDNLKSYISASDNAKSYITMKYILIDNINDNVDEIYNFLKLVKNLGIINVRLDFDYEKYKFSDDVKVPEYYFDLYKKFNNYAKELELKVQGCGQIDAILEKSR